jgi:hypothetical protein
VVIENTVSTLRPTIWIPAPTSQIGVTFLHCGERSEGIILQVDWQREDARTIEVECWTPIGEGRYSWFTGWYAPRDLTVDLEVVRPVECLNADDLERAVDDGSETEAARERVERVQFWLNGIGGYAE